MSRVLRRILPYGTEREVEVLEVVERPTNTTLICGDGEEGYVCLYKCGTVQAKKGDKGILTLTEGGPMGSYWQYTPKV